MSISETNSKRDRKKNKYDAFNMSISWKEAFYGEDWKEKGIKPKGNAPSIRILPLVEVVFNDKLKMRVISNISKKKTVTKINTVDKLMDAMDDALSSSTLQQIRKEMNEKLNMKNYKENVLEKLKVFDKKNKNVVVFGELKAWKTFFKQRMGHLFKQISVGLTTKFKNDGFGKLAAIESVNEPKKKKRTKRSLHRISGNASVCVFFLFFFPFAQSKRVPLHHHHYHHPFHHHHHHHYHHQLHLLPPMKQPSKQSNGWRLTLNERRKRFLCLDSIMEPIMMFMMCWY